MEIQRIWHSYISQVLQRIIYVLWHMKLQERQDKVRQRLLTFLAESAAKAEEDGWAQSIARGGG